MELAFDIVPDCVIVSLKYTVSPGAGFCKWIPAGMEAFMVLRNDSDFLMRVVVNSYAIRLAYGAFRQLGSEGIRRHDADPVAGRLLTGVLSSAALMSVLLDAGEKFSIRIDYNGPAAGLLAYEDASLERGGAAVLCACLCGGALAGLLSRRPGKKRKR